MSARLKLRGASRASTVLRVLHTFTPAHRGGHGTPLVCLHGFGDTWRTWELVLATLERHHDVLAPTLPGHAGGPPPAREVDNDVALDALERALDDAGFETAHLVGNSLGGYLALALAARGRARSVVAFAPAGGWTAGDPSRAQILEAQAELAEQLRAAAPHADAIAATPEGRRRATALISVNFEHIPAELVAHQICGFAAADTEALLAGAARSRWPLAAERIGCPVRIVWGTADRLLAWPSAAARFRAELPQADWVLLDGVGHCPQLDVPLEAAQLIVGFTGG
jgi:pimeloyl-ACP methyl ester carboxylesterase